MIDSSLNWKKHVEYVSTKLARITYLMRNLRYIMPLILRQFTPHRIMKPENVRQRALGWRGRRLDVVATAAAPPWPWPDGATAAEAVETLDLSKSQGDHVTSMFAKSDRKKGDILQYQQYLSVSEADISKTTSVHGPKDVRVRQISYRVEVEGRFTFESFLQQNFDETGGGKVCNCDLRERYAVSSYDTQLLSLCAAQLRMYAEERKLFRGTTSEQKNVSFSKQNSLIFGWHGHTRVSEELQHWNDTAEGYMKGNIGKGRRRRFLTCRNGSLKKIKGEHKPDLVLRVAACSIPTKHNGCSFNCFGTISNRYGTQLPGLPSDSLE
ncbi:hypothetical protein C0J52_27542 [Blattella germanica]|nr:hypothetical protein C0J52_27542 [Blattella germanica]